MNTNNPKFERDARQNVSIKHQAHAKDDGVEGRDVPETAALRTYLCLSAQHATPTPETLTEVTRRLAEVSSCTMSSVVTVTQPTMIVVREGGVQCTSRTSWAGHRVGRRASRSSWLCGETPRGRPSLWRHALNGRHRSLPALLSSFPLPHHRPAHAHRRCCYLDTPSNTRISLQAPTHPARPGGAVSIVHP